jgi:hypothetical protein
LPVALEGERGQLESGHPPLQRAVQGADLVGGQVEAHRLVQEARRLVDPELELVDPDFHQVAVGAQAGQGHARNSARAQHEVQRWGHMLQQPGERLVNRFVMSQVGIVDNDDQVARQVVGKVADLGQHRVAVWLGPAKAYTRRRVANAWLHHLPSQDEEPEEAIEVIVLVVERDPGHRIRTRPCPLGQEGGLAIAGRGGDQHDPGAGDSLLEHGNQVIALHGVNRRWGNVELRRAVVRRQESVRFGHALIIEDMSIMVGCRTGAAVTWCDG